MTLTDLLIPTYRNMLRTLRGLLDKAEAQLGADGAGALLAARANGVAIGKADYVPHMFAYLRPAPAA